MRELPADPETTNELRQVTGALYSPVSPTPVTSEPYLVAYSKEVGGGLGGCVDVWMCGWVDGWMGRHWALGSGPRRRLAGAKAAPRTACVASAVVWVVGGEMGYFVEVLVGTKGVTSEPYYLVA